MSKPEIKPETYFKPHGIRRWIKSAGFTSDKSAAESLGVPFRTFGRWKAKGLPVKSPANLIYSRFIVAKMIKYLEDSAITN